MQFKVWCHVNHSAPNKQQCVPNDKGNQMRSHMAQLDDLSTLPGFMAQLDDLFTLPELFIFQSLIGVKLVIFKSQGE